MYNIEREREREGDGVLFSENLIVCHMAFASGFNTVISVYLDFEIPNMTCM